MQSKSQTDKFSSLAISMSGLDYCTPDRDQELIYETRLVHRIGEHAVVYCTRSRQLYFWEKEGGPIKKTIQAALLGCGGQYQEFDVNRGRMGVFSKPRKVMLSREQMNVVGTALRLLGAQIFMAHPDQHGQITNTTAQI